jgi:hypothetical protein
MKHHITNELSYFYHLLPIAKIVQIPFVRFTSTLQ